MRELVFLLEEPSAKELLKGVLPRLLPSMTSVRYVVFEGKQDLERQIERRLRGYQVSGARFIILRDKDSSDCRHIKASLVARCVNAGRADALVRIACHEIESWYLADLLAVEKGLGMRGLAVQQRKNKFREPDLLGNAAAELVKLNRQRYQKVGGSRATARWRDLNNTRSKSFAVFISGLKRLAAES